MQVLRSQTRRGDARVREKNAKKRDDVDRTGRVPVSERKHLKHSGMASGFSTILEYGNTRVVSKKN